MKKKALTTKIVYAVEAGELPQPFTSMQMKEWAKDKKILNDRTGLPYKENSLNAVLANADKKNEGSSNRNEKFIYSAGPKNKKLYFINSDPLENKK